MSQDKINELNKKRLTLIGQMMGFDHGHGVYRVYREEVKKLEAELYKLGWRRPTLEE